MIKIRPAVFRRNIRSLLKTALTKPVYISRRKGKKDLVLISTQHYQELQRYNRKAILTSELTEHDVKLIHQSSMSEEHMHLNTELEPTLK